LQFVGIILEQFVACIFDPDNTGSVNVALKCRYREITRTSYKGSPTILFERERTTA
jgi:hypothetical protein